MNKNTTILTTLLLLAAALAAMPMASAHDHTHEQQCTDDNPCENNQGCNGTAGVNCEYDQRTGCVAGADENGEQGKWCSYQTRPCFISVQDRCHLHGGIDFPVMHFRALR